MRTTEEQPSSDHYSISLCGNPFCNHWCCVMTRKNVYWYSNTFNTSKKEALQTVLCTQSSQTFSSLLL